MPIFNQIYTATITNGGGTINLDVTDSTTTRYIFSGTATLAGSWVIQPTGSPSQGTEFDIRWQAPTTIGANNVTIFGVALTAEQALQDLQITCYYNGSSWNVDIVSDGIVNDSVTNSKLAEMATMTMKGNNTGVSANPQDLSISQVKTMLGATMGAIENNTPQSTTVQGAGGALFVDFGNTFNGEYLIVCHFALTGTATNTFIAELLVDGSVTSNNEGTSSEIRGTTNNDITFTDVITITTGQDLQLRITKTNANGVSTTFQRALMTYIKL